MTQRAVFIIALLVSAPIAAGAADQVAICHLSANGEAHTITVGAPSVAAHLANGDTIGDCADSGGGCLCSEPLVWGLSADDGLFCAFTGKGGAISVCTPDGEPTCVALSGDGIPLPLEDCAGCLPAELDDAVVRRCAQVPQLLGF
jgi:hypothetical protein